MKNTLTIPQNFLDGDLMNKMAPSWGKSIVELYKAFMDISFIKKNKCILRK
jgi:hypothetical protein